MSGAPEKAPESWIRRQTGMTESHVQTRRRGDNFKTLKDGTKVRKTGPRGRHLICNIHVGTDDHAYRENFDRIFGEHVEEIETKEQRKARMSDIKAALKILEKQIWEVERVDDQITLYTKVGEKLATFKITKDENETR